MPNYQIYNNIININIMLVIIRSIFNILGYIYMYMQRGGRNTSRSLDGK